MDQPIWIPSSERVASAQMTMFMATVEDRWKCDIDDFKSLYQWSIDEPEQFWTSIWEFCHVRAHAQGQRVLIDGHKMPGACFFPDAQLNYAENILQYPDESDALVFWGEDRIIARLTRRELYDLVSRLRQVLVESGVGPGDRIAGFVPNMPETIVAMLAAASLGAVWSSCSPDFGNQGVLDRFGQIEPKILFAADGYFYNGKPLDCLQRIKTFLPHLPTIKRTIIFSYIGARSGIDDIPHASLFEDAIAPYCAGPIEFTQVPFNHPLFIMFSSGTTGKPKCIIHGAGGTLLQHLKEHRLHCDIKSGDRVFYFTTCGWMMWNWLVSALASQATLLLYDGSPFYRSGTLLFDLAETEKMTLFGTAAKFIDACQKAELEPMKTHQLDHLRTITSTGSPLSAESFDYVYSKIKSDVHLASISGGTDILSCFALGNPISPVWRGELQTRGLGMAVEVWDDHGRAIRGAKGELVCVKPFPSMPLGFWNDPDNRRYQSAYFERYTSIWHHGDYVALTEHDGLIIYGRSDTVLNPGGVRIGTAEIYRQVDRLPEVEESIVIGQEWQEDIRVVLFVRLRHGLVLDHTMIEYIKRHIKQHCTPRHVPGKISNTAKESIIICARTPSPWP